MLLLKSFVLVFLMIGQYQVVSGFIIKPSENHGNDDKSPTDHPLAEPIHVEDSPSGLTKSSPTDKKLEKTVPEKEANPTETLQKVTRVEALTGCTTWACFFENLDFLKTKFGNKISRSTHKEKDRKVLRFCCKSFTPWITHFRYLAVPSGYEMTFRS